MHKKDADIIKVIDTDSEISCINYGPFDNGHIIIGLENGFIILFKYPNLERIYSRQLFNGSPVTSITFDPTNLIFVGGHNGDMVSLSCIDQSTNYLYLDFGKNKYFTVTMPKPVGHEMNDSIDANKRINCFA